MDNNTRQNLVVRVHTELRDFLKRQAVAERRKLSDYCRVVLEDHRNKIEQVQPEAHV